jgi:hypothetical protein
VYALFLRLSYVISFFILYWVGFYSVNIIQLIIVLFFLMFLINQS